MKSNYSIPLSLETSYLDLEIKLQNKEGVGLKKPVNLLTIVGFLGSFLLMFWLFLSGPLESAPLWTKIVTGIFWLGLTALLFKTDKTRREGFRLLVSATTYFPASNRRVKTRLNNKALPFKQLLNISSVDPEDGLIHFMDGHVGRVLAVVGTASALMFDEDKAKIIGAVDKFYRKIPVDCDIMYDSLKEAQRTDEQVRSSINRRKRLRRDSKGLKRLFQEQHDVLKHAIGSKYKSIHQYAIIRAPNDESYNELESLIYADAEGQGLMFKKVQPLTFEQTAEYFKGVYNAEHS